MMPHGNQAIKAPTQKLAGELNLKPKEKTVVEINRVREDTA